MIYFLHGFGGDPSDWDEVISVIPGKAFSIPACELKSAITTLCEKIDHPNFSLCGYSMGGRIALLMADQLLREKRPPLSLVLISSGLGLPESERSGRRAIDEEWADLVRNSPQDFWTKWYGQELFQSLSQLPQNRLSTWMQKRNSLHFNHLETQLRSMGPANHAELMEPLKRLLTAGVKVLYIAGELDKKYSRLAAELRKMPKLQTLVLTGGGHILPLEKPQELARSIAIFLQENGAEHGKKH